MVLKFAVAVIIILAVSFTLSYLSEFNKSGKIVYNTTGLNNGQPEQFYQIWIYIIGTIATILAMSTVIYKIKKKVRKN